MTVCSDGKCSFWNELVPGGSLKVHAAININYFKHMPKTSVTDIS